MFTHVIALTLKEDAGPAAADAVAEGLLGLLGQVPGLASVEVGRDLGLTPGNAQVVALMRFDSESAWRDYGGHPAHKALVGGTIAPVLASKAALQVAGFEGAGR